MAAYRRVYDSRHLQAAKNRDQLRNPTLGNRVRATFIFLQLVCAYRLAGYRRMDKTPCYCRLGDSSPGWRLARSPDRSHGSPATLDPGQPSPRVHVIGRLIIAQGGQGRLNQWAHWARAHAPPPDFFFLRGPQLAVVKYIFKTNYLIVDATA